MLFFKTTIFQYPLTEVYAFYSLRQQIELLFKINLYSLRLCLFASVTPINYKDLYERHKEKMSKLKYAYMVQIYQKNIHRNFFVLPPPVLVLSNLFQAISKQNIEKSANRLQIAP